MEGATDAAAVAVPYFAPSRMFSPRQAPTVPNATPVRNAPTRLLWRRASKTSDCVASASANLCEKPMQNQTLIIALSVVIPLVILAVVLFFLHRRNLKRQRMEDANDPHRSLDFGLDQKKRKSYMNNLSPKEKHTRNQMSMDMNLSSPYLLPPELQNSRESLNSLARTIHQQEDPYRPVTQYTVSDGASVRSMPRGSGKEGSVYAKSTLGPSRSTTMDSDGSTLVGSRQKSPLGQPEPVHKKPEPLQLGDMDQSLTPAPLSPRPPQSPAQSSTQSPPPPPTIAEPIIPQILTVSDEPHAAPSIPTIQEPPAAALKTRGPRSPTSPSASSPADSAVDVNLAAFDFGTGQKDTTELHMSPPPTRELPETPKERAERLAQSSPASQPVVPMPFVQEPEDFSHDDYVDMPVPDEHHGEQKDEARQNHLEVDDEPRGRNMQRTSQLYANRQSQFLGANRQSQFLGALGVPGQDNRRLSVGFRPLPPDDVTNSDDPEFRANRIRSFYKEYFEERRLSELPPMPAVPVIPDEHVTHQQHEDYATQDHGGQQQGHQDGHEGHYDQYQQQDQQYQQHDQQYQQQQYQQAPQHYQGHADAYGGYNGSYNGGVDYYEDYDQNFLGDATYFDPESNSFITPYAQPVSRRAMTPPPSSHRFPGPRGGPRPHYGSMSGMNPPGVRGGPPRPGSSASNRPPGPGFHQGPGGWGGRPRAGSTMSGGRFGGPNGGPRKPMPPPAALNTLPTPSKLKDDSFAILGAIDFAPPDSFADRQRGRSQSPAGERRPYKVHVPVASPLANAFDELAALPSPHLLRKSGTFTALDFAPPRKFADPDSRSETGSIRSNRSGISTTQLSAIRNGAGRVSRLPGDQVFTQAAMQDQLKPKWGMRP